MLEERIELPLLVEAFRQLLPPGVRVHEALVTLDENGDPQLMRRPPIERYDLFRETVSPANDDLFSPQKRRSAEEE